MTQENLQAENAELKRKLAELSEALREPCLCMRTLSGDKRRHATGCHQLAALASQPAPEAKPVPLVLYCPAGHLHVDEGEWATRPHKTHQCQRPAAPSDAKAGERP
jgi:hypothetical protein